MGREKEGGIERECVSERERERERENTIMYRDEGRTPSLPITVH